MIKHMIATLPISGVFEREAAEKQKRRVGDCLDFKGPLGNLLGFAEILEVDVRHVDPDSEYFGVTLKIKGYTSTSPEDRDELFAERRRLRESYADRLGLRYDENHSAG